MAKVLASLAQYDDDNEEVRGRAIVIMNSFVWQVGSVHSRFKYMDLHILRLYVVCCFGNDRN